MFSDNIVERHQALADLFTLDASSFYIIGIIVLAIVSFKLKDMF